MKLSTLTLTIALTIASASALSKNVVFKPVQNDLETQVCLTAATEGFDAAKNLVKENDINFWKFNYALSCNGESLKDFANKYQTTEALEENAQEKVRSVRLVAKNDAAASKVCLDALVIGETAARRKHGIVQEDIYCNQQNITSFVRKFSKPYVEVRTSAE